MTRLFRLSDSLCAVVTSMFTCKCKRDYISNCFDDIAFMNKYQITFSKTVLENLYNVEDVLKADESFL